MRNSRKIIALCIKTEQWCSIQDDYVLFKFIYVFDSQGFN
ncbi:hypothetical protein M23134_05895 [Microscilla marina ATCC 23134]|uniref:Uncharacterized protein n=1 Tax=Microscilla marina ATCC 23134 TaxID=313606 RepID=A1ZWU8_MICM2|nr:hypothetical protein M23134_05895 [Microscilla marina ATCC 23134]